uniref:Uncharacterized protein n=1 Tax=Plectus sambesii TaxID=2011161 RepID=A0A914UQV3_9BILA
MMSEQTLVDCGSLIVAPDISEQIRDLEERLASKDALISSLQMDLDARNNAAVTDVQPLENRVAELQASLAVAQDDIKKRDRTIQGLVKHVKKHSSVDAVEVSANVKEKKQLETEVAAAAEVRDALLSELGDHSAEEMSVLDARRIHADIDRLRTDLDRLTGENGVLQQQLQALDAAADPATEANLSQLSEFAKQSDNLNRIMRDRLSTLIAKVGDESLFNHLRALNDTSRHATQSAFDTPPSTAPLRVATAAHFEQSTTTPGGRRVSFAVDLIDMTSATDLYNRSVNTTQDLHNLKDKLYLLRTICERLFGKLKGSAEFLKDLLEQLGGSELAKKFADGFDSLHFDLDASMRQAQSLLDEVKTAEKSIADLTAQLDQVVNQSMTARSAGQSILTGQEFGLDDSQLHRDSGVTSGTPGTDRHAGGHAEVDRLQQQLQNEREVARSQHSERDALKAALDSELKAKEALESRLASASSENEHLRRELDQADARIAETYDAMKEKDIEMQNVHATLKELDKKLVTMREQHAIEMNERIGRVNELQSRLQQLSQQATTVDELAARLKAADDKLVDASAQSQSLSAMLDQQRQRCLDIQTDAERARAQAKHQSQRAQQLTAEVERLTKAIVESQTLSAAAKKEFDVTRRQLVEAQQSAKEAFDQ